MQSRHHTTNRRAANAANKLLRTGVGLRFGYEIDADPAQLLCTMPSAAQWLTRDELASLLTGVDEDGQPLRRASAEPRPSDRNMIAPWIFRVISAEAKRRGALLLLDAQAEIQKDYIDPTTAAFISAYSRLAESAEEPDPMQSAFKCGLAQELLNKARIREREEQRRPAYLEDLMIGAAMGAVFEITEQARRLRRETEFYIAQRAIDAGFDAYRLRRIQNR